MYKLQLSTVKLGKSGIDFEVFLEFFFLIKSPFLVFE